MPESGPRLRGAIQNQLSAFKTRSLKDAALGLLAKLVHVLGKLDLDTATSR